MRIMSTPHAKWMLGALLIVLNIGLAACGVTSTTGAGSGATATPASNQQTGCPGVNQTVSRAPASVVVKPNGTIHQVTLHVGQTLEVDLPFGEKWSLFPSSAPTLAMQSPAGFGDVTVHSCVWRFTAAQAGSTSITFIFAPLCLPTMVRCSQLEGHSAFDVTVQ